MSKHVHKLPYCVSFEGATANSAGPFHVLSKGGYMIALADGRSNSDARKDQRLIDLQIKYELV